MALSRTVVLVRNDALLDIERDPKFALNLARGIVISLNHNVPVDIPCLGFSSAAVVVGPHTEDENGVAGSGEDD